MPTYEEILTAVQVLEWVRETAEEGEGMSDQDRATLGSAALWTESFLRGVIKLPPASQGSTDTRG